MSKVTAAKLERFLDFFEKDNYSGLCSAALNYGAEGKRIRKYCSYHIPMSVISNSNDYWWPSGYKEPRIKFLKAHIKALKMNPISRWFYYIYLHLTL